MKKPIKFRESELEEIVNSPAVAAPTVIIDPHHERRDWSEVVIPVGADRLTATTYLPGLAGDITEWSIRGAQRVARVMSAAGAFMVLGTLGSRYLVTPTASSSQLFMAILAPSGWGK